MRPDYVDLYDKICRGVLGEILIRSFFVEKEEP